MFLRKKAQSTAEYAIVIGLVIAVSAGVLQLALKSAIREKHKQATNWLLNSTGTLIPWSNTTAEKLYTQEKRTTTINSVGFKDDAIMEKGGLEKKIQSQSQATTAITVELINGTN